MREAGMPKNETIKKTDIATLLGKPHKVILFNDEVHSMDEVAAQIQKATGFALQKAWAIMMEAHTGGSAVVITAPLERCEHVASVLEQIRLGTRIEKA
jgi:ATP-dependent Clp protease adaptor protein ClpS